MEPQATHQLVCSHVYGSESRRHDYFMPCEIIKEMPDNQRYKVRVFGERFWQDSRDTKSKIRYVQKSRVRKINLG